MLPRSRSERTVRLRLAATAAVAGLISVTTARASLLFDDISAYQSGRPGTHVAYPTQSQNTFTGDAFVLPSGTTDITGVDLFPVNKTATIYTSLQISICFWGTVNTGTVSASAPAFSNELGIIALDEPGTYTPGFYYPFQGPTPGASPGITFNSPMQLDGATTIGITIDYEGSTNGTTYQTSNNLTSLLSYGVAPTVGSEVFNGYYINANNETNSNFISTLSSLGGYADQGLAIRIFGDIATSPTQWTSNSGGNWSIASNWSTSAVPSSTIDAAFNLSSSNYTVTVSAAGVCKDLYVQSDNVTLEMSAADSSLSIGGALTVGQPATAGTSISGILNLTQSYGGTLMNISAGSVASGGNGGTGVLTIGSGVRLISTSAVSVAIGSSIIISPGGKLVAPSISIAGTTNAWTGLLDIGTGALDLPSANLATVTNQVKQGYNANGGGSWNGTGGITSSAAANDSTHLTAVGVILNNNGNGSPLYGNSGALGLFGSSNPSLNDILVRYTYYGDANLDGTVDGSDYSLIDNGYLNKLTGWYNGDFNYDGVVDGSDYTLIDNAFNNQGAGLIADAAIAPQNDSSLATGGTSSAPAGVTAISTAMVASDTTAVPEPASLGFLAVAIVPLLRRRSGQTFFPYWRNEAL